MTYHGEVVVLKCVAFGSRPEARLLWKSGSIDQYIDTGTLNKPNVHNPILLDYESHLNVTVKGRIHISCSSNLSSSSLMQHATLDIKINGESKTHHNIQCNYYVTSRFASCF